MPKKKPDILVVAAQPQYPKQFAHLSKDYNLHFLYLDYISRLNIFNFNIIRYLNNARKLIRKHKIKGIFYRSDIGSLIAAVLCEEFNLPGPSLESAFVCYHKYYTRIFTGSCIGFNSILLKKPTQTQHKYPFFIKAPCSTAGVLGFPIRSKSDWARMIRLAKKELPKMNNHMFPLLKKHVDPVRFPLALQHVLLMEDLILDDQVTIEGFVHDGQVSFTTITDRKHVKGARRLVDYYRTPTDLSNRQVRLLKEQATKDIKSVGLDNSLFNIDYWVKGNNVTLIEVNSRAATLFYRLYQEMYQYDIHRAGIELSLGHKPTIRLRKSRVDRVGGLFNLNTTKEGQVSTLFDYEAKLPFHTHILIEQGAMIRQLSEFGQVIARIVIFGKTIDQIKRIANVYRKKALRA